jgi:hypothetical protein
MAAYHEEKAIVAVFRDMDEALKWLGITESPSIDAVWR